MLFSSRGSHCLTHLSKALCDPALNFTENNPIFPILHSSAADKLNASPPHNAEKKVEQLVRQLLQKAHL